MVRIYYGEHGDCLCFDEKREAQGIGCSAPRANVRRKAADIHNVVVIVEESSESLERVTGVVAGEGRDEGGGREALRRWRVLMGNLVRQVEHTGTGWQKMDRQTEQTKPMSTIFL